MNLYGKLIVKKKIGEGQLRMIVLHQKHTNTMCYGGGNLYKVISIQNLEITISTISISSIIIFKLFLI